MSDLTNMRAMENTLKQHAGSMWTTHTYCGIQHRRLRGVAYTGAFLMRSITCKRCLASLNRISRESRAR